MSQAHATKPLLTGVGLRLNYGSVEALAGVDLTVEVGSIIAVVGANGCGKSSLLRVLACVTPDGVSSGRVEYAGLNASSHGDRGRALAAVRALVPQRPEVGAAFSAREVVRLGRYAVGPDEHAVDRALADVGLSARASVAYTALSGGERQRVAIARALAQLDHGGVLLLDEPFGGIDPGEVVRIARALHARAQKGAVVMSLHDPGLARAIATHALVLQAGRAMVFGLADQVLTAAHLTKAYGSPMREASGWIMPQLDAPSFSSQGRMQP